MRLADAILDDCLCDPAAPLARDPAHCYSLDKAQAQAQLASLKDWLRVQQTMLWANRRDALLLVLQGPDCSGKNGKKVSEYFRDFIGCQEGVDGPGETRTLLKAFSDYVESEDLPEEKAREKTSALVGYASSQAKIGEPMSLEELSGVIDEENPRAFYEHIRNKDYGLSPEIPADKRTLNQFQRFTGRAEGLSISCSWLPWGKSVRPMLPANSTSPTNARSICGAWNTTWPGVWPGQWRTCSTSLPICTWSPSCSQRVGVKGSAGGKPNMALCCPRPSIQNWSPGCGPTMGICRRCASSPVPPAWSMWAWVSQICESVRPRRWISASRVSRSPPGSITAAWWVASHQTMEQFC